MNKTTISKQLYQYGDQQLEYTLVKSRRRKTSEVIVDENEITLRIPFHKSLSDAENLMGSKIRWIITKQKEYRERIPEIVKPTFLQGSTLPYLGKNYEIEIIKNENNDDDKIELQHDKFIVALSFKKNNLNVKDNRIKFLYEDWLYRQTKKVFEEKIGHFSKVLNVNPKKVRIKNLKNRWGSLTKNKIINLNLNLMKAPEHVIDYIIIHELCHFKIKGHSHKFWAYLHNFVPNYEDQINWLAINASNILS